MLLQSKREMFSQKRGGRLSIWVIVRLKLWAKRASQRIKGHIAAHDTIGVVREILSYVHALYYVSY